MPERDRQELDALKQRIEALEARLAVLESGKKRGKAKEESDE